MQQAKVLLELRGNESITGTKGLQRRMRKYFGGSDG